MKKNLKERIKVISLLFLLFGIGGNCLNAQDTRQISVAIINESITFPFTSYSEFHPGVEFGMSLRSVEKERTASQITGYAGWYLHQHVQNCFFLRADYRYEWKAFSHLRAGVYGGVGYMHTFYPGKLYEMDPQTDDFQEATQLGRPRALVSAGIQLSWYFENEFSVFLKQEFALETPFANGIPFMPHSFIKLGISKNI